MAPPVFLVIDFGVNSNKVGGHNFEIWLALQVFATLYVTIWDYYMDWGLFRSTKPEAFGLRDQMKYPKIFYYYAILLNFVLRFFWLFGIFTFAF